eukprot:9544985-Prorocentrum_lima.AAC.1
MAPNLSQNGYGYGGRYSTHRDCGRLLIDSLWGLVLHPQGCWSTVDRFSRWIGTPPTGMLVDLFD